MNESSSAADRNKAQELCELDMLAGAAFEAERWVALNQSGISEADFFTRRGRRVYAALCQHYASAEGPPQPIERLVAFSGLEAEDIRELMGRFLSSTSATTSELAEQLREHARSHERRAKIAEAQGALARGQADVARSIIDEVQQLKSGVVRTAISWIEADEIFNREYPETPWIARGLQIGPGRPAMLAGYGSSAKTWAVQSLALAVAAGRVAWGYFETAEPRRVLHLDYEQGARATSQRYRRLAVGHDIDVEDVIAQTRMTTFAMRAMVCSFL